MNKGLITLAVGICSIIGSYIPVLLGQSGFSVASILGGLIGGIFGVWAAVKLNAYF